MILMYSGLHIIYMKDNLPKLIPKTIPPPYPHLFQKTDPPTAGACSWELLVYIVQVYPCYHTLYLGIWHLDADVALHFSPYSIWIHLQLFGLALYGRLCTHVDKPLIIVIQLFWASLVYFKCPKKAENSWIRGYTMQCFIKNTTTTGIKAPPNIPTHERW